jgi:uncharacterized membrane protein YtjA (UPF0391 family)
MAAPFSPSVGRFRSLRSRDFERFSLVEQTGTSVSSPDYFRGRSRNRADRTEGGNRGADMLSWVVTFLVIALIAGILGFGGIAGASIEIAKIIFFVAIVLFLVSAVVGLTRGRPRV